MVLFIILRFRFYMQPSDATATEKTSSAGTQQNKDGKIFFKSPRSKAQSADKDTSSFPYGSGKIVLKSSPKSKAGKGRAKQPALPSWINDIDDVFSFHAED